jgi:hypothetical protein
LIWLELVFAFGLFPSVLVGSLAVHAVTRRMASSTWAPESVF